jgi:hypothetical protein
LLSSDSLLSSLTHIYTVAVSDNPCALPPSPARAYQASPTPLSKSQDELWRKRHLTI